MVRAMPIAKGMARPLLFLVAVFTLFALALPTEAQERPPADAPPWVHYQFGTYLFAEGNHGGALVSFRRALAAGYPEAEMGIGMVHVADGDLVLGRINLEAALEKAATFDVRNHRYTILYALADIAFLEGDDHGYETTLQRITADDPAYASENAVRQRRRYIEQLEQPDQTAGIDGLLSLFRQDQGYFAREAHRRLGLHFAQLGNYTQALDHLLAVLLKVVTKTVNEIRLFYVDYEYTTLENLIETASRREEAYAYLQETRFVEALYWIGEVLYFRSDLESTREEARRLFGLIAGGDPGFVGDFRFRAQAQLDDPQRSIRPE